MPSTTPPEPASDTRATVTVAGGRRWHGWLRLVLGVAGAIVAVFFLRHVIEHPAELWRTVSMANGWWLAGAVAAQALSLLMFAFQQQRLLRAFGGSMRTSFAIRLTFARTAISVIVPAGAAVSAGLAINQFRRHGADAAGAAALTVLTGVQSAVALFALYLAWLATVGWHSTDQWQLRTVLLVGAVLVVVAAVGIYLRHRPHSTHGSDTTARTPAGRWLRSGRSFVRTGVRHAASLSARDWATSGSAAAANWLFDLVCLLVTARAFGLDVGIVPVTGAYLAAQLIRQIPLTPGGVGVVEASLIVALVASGATTATATATVLVYRLVSCWLIAAIGLPMSAGLRDEYHA